MKHAFLFWALVFSLTSPFFCLAQQQQQSLTWQIDARGSLPINFDTEFFDIGLGIENLVVNKANWQLGTRLGFLYDRRRIARSSEAFNTFWFTFDINSYHRLGANWWGFGGLGGAWGMQAFEYCQRTDCYWATFEDYWAYIQLGAKKNFKNNKLFFQMQARLFPFPDADFLIYRSRLEVSFGIRLGQSTQP
ncbi:MAG: hypothetical protein AAF927_29240 [Bacteroidota bacterium]